MNRNSAIEWLKKVFHDLKSAQILYEANHYTDSIGVDLHYAIEKSFKTFLAYENKKISKSHDLHLLRGQVEDYIKFSFEEVKIINMATDYYIEESYPQYDRKLPSREEIKEVLKFTEYLFDKVCIILDIEKDELL
jgi:HEPN domain-containing protein